MLGKDIAYENLLDQLNDGVFFVDANAILTYWNRGAERITGLSRQEVIDLPCTGAFLGHVDHAGNPMFDGASPVQLCLCDGQTRESELYIRHASGNLVPVLVRVSPILNTLDEVIGAIEVFSDITSKVAALQRIEELEELALVCPVTEVGNRRYAEMALNNAFDELRRYEWKFGLLFADIDRFKAVNDTHGHHVGDDVLRMVAHALRACLRSFDFVGRWGGEEFVVLLPNITDDVLGRVAERCRASVESAYVQVQGVAIRVTVSIGGVMALPGENTAQLVTRADQLMYRSKQQGGNQVTLDT